MTALLTITAIGLFIDAILLLAVLKDQKRPSNTLFATGRKIKIAAYTVLGARLLYVAVTSSPQFNPIAVMALFALSIAELFGAVDILFVNYKCASCPHSTKDTTCPSGAKCRILGREIPKDVMDKGQKVVWCPLEKEESA